MNRRLSLLLIPVIVAPAIQALAIYAQADPVAVDINTRDIVRHVVPRDAIPALNMPRYDPLKDATYLRSDDRIIALEFEGQELAYPTRILEHHEIVNDFVNGKPILVTY